MSWWTLQVVVVIVGVGTRAVTQETGPHSGPTAADRGYTAGEFIWLGTAPLWDRQASLRNLQDLMRFAGATLALR